MRISSRDEIGFGDVSRNMEGGKVESGHREGRYECVTLLSHTAKTIKFVQDSFSLPGAACYADL